jgi:hypothetical protein
MSEVLYLRAAYYWREGAYSIALREVEQGLTLFMQSERDYPADRRRYYKEPGEVYLAMGDREEGLAKLGFALNVSKTRPLPAADWRSVSEEFRTTRHRATPLHWYR